MGDRGHECETIAMRPDAPITDNDAAQTGRFTWEPVYLALWESRRRHTKSSKTELKEKLIDTLFKVKIICRMFVFGPWEH